MRNNETLKLGIGYILNFSRDTKELSQEDMMDKTSETLFSVFAGSDNKLDIKEKENLWEQAKRFASANKTGNVEDDKILDQKELKAFLDATVKDTELIDRISLKNFSNFLMKVFQKPHQESYLIYLIILFETLLIYNRQFVLVSYEVLNVQDKK